MTDRIIDISEESVHLSARNSLLVIERSCEEVTIPLEDIAVVVVSHPWVTFTHAVFTGLAQAGASVVLCDGKHMPAAMLMPLESHFTQAERFVRQARAPAPVCKQLWKQLVRAKIKAQARLLQELRGDDSDLSDLITKVRSGDPTNVESQASRRYWPALFGAEFRRDRFGEDENRFLNYGYAVLRAIVARAVCAAGLHPSLGLHHHNRYDAFCLVDDLMEPFRPIVDRAVFHLCEERGAAAPLDKQTKAALLGALTGKYEVEGEKRTLFDIVTRTAQSLAAVFAGERDRLVLPDV